MATVLSLFFDLSFISVTRLNAFFVNSMSSLIAIGGSIGIAGRAAATGVADMLWAYVFSLFLVFPFFWLVLLVFRFGFFIEFSLAIRGCICVVFEWLVGLFCCRSCVKWVLNPK